MRQALHRGIVIGLVEEEERGLAEMGHLARRVGHAVECRDPLVIGPIRHQVADIYGESVGDARYRLPLTRLGIDL